MEWGAVAADGRSFNFEGGSGLATSQCWRPRDAIYRWGGVWSAKEVEVTAKLSEMEVREPSHDELDADGQLTTPMHEAEANIGRDRKGAPLRPG
ncbi:MAG: hypothetical protein ACKER6_01185 [Candidatus Hodgkinia cicadicola]